MARVDKAKSQDSRSDRSYSSYSSSKNSSRYSKSIEYKYQKHKDFYVCRYCHSKIDYKWKHQWRMYKHEKEKENPKPSRVIGVFGLHPETREGDLELAFRAFGEIKSITIVFDHQTGYSRGFGFITYSTVMEATQAKEEMNGQRMDGRVIRVDYSITKKAHDPTPGRYLGAYYKRCTSSYKRRD